MHKEEERWERIEAEKKKEEERVLYLRDHTLKVKKKMRWIIQNLFTFFSFLSFKAKKNESSVPYDPVTLKYNDNADGIRLRYSFHCIFSMRNSFV